MTGTELSTALGLRMGDAGEGVFTVQIKVDAINSAQRTIANLIDDAYLSDLEEIKDNQALAVGTNTSSVSFATAGIDVLRGRVIGVFDEGQDIWCSIISARDAHQLDNAYLNGTTSNPVAYTFNETLYVKPTTVTTVDIWYLKSPTSYIYNSSGSMATECELNPALQELVLDFAESQLWRTDGKLNRAESTNNSAVAQIQILNNKVQVNKNVGGSNR